MSYYGFCIMVEGRSDSARMLLRTAEGKNNGCETLRIRATSLIRIFRQLNSSGGNHHHSSQHIRSTTYANLVSKIAISTLLPRI